MFCLDTFGISIYAKKIIKQNVFSITTVVHGTLYHETCRCFYGPGLNFDSGQMIHINLHQQLKEMMTNSDKHKMVMTPVRSGQCQVYRDFKWTPPGRSKLEKISSNYFAIRTKNKNLAGWSGIGVLVVRFSWIGASKKKKPHSSLVCFVVFLCVLLCTNVKGPRGVVKSCAFSLCTFSCTTLYLTGGNHSAAALDQIDL